MDNTPDDKLTRASAQEADLLAILDGDGTTSSQTHQNDPSTPAPEIQPIPHENSLLGGLYDDNMSNITREDSPLIISQEDNRPDITENDPPRRGNRLQAPPVDTYFSDERIRIPDVEDVSYLMICLF